MIEPKLFCSDLCKDEADFIRYVRRCRAEGRIQKSDVRDAIRIRMAHLVSGGYNWRARRLTEAQRQAVIVRDDGKCTMCGASGSEIDHIQGNDNALNNLQLLCRGCHVEKTKSRIAPLSPDDADADAKRRYAMHLKHRFSSRKPVRVADDENNWPAVWRQLLKARKDGEPDPVEAFESPDDWWTPFGWGSPEEAFEDMEPDLEE